VGHDRARIEALIAEVWREVLGIETVSANDYFFDLGGDSMNAVAAVAGIWVRTGAEVDVEDLLLQTLGQLATYCTNHARPHPHPHA